MLRDFCVSGFFGVEWVDWGSYVNRDGVGASVSPESSGTGYSMSKSVCRLILCLGFAMY